MKYERERDVGGGAKVEPVGKHTHMNWSDQ